MVTKVFMTDTGESVSVLVDDALTGGRGRVCSIVGDDAHVAKLITPVHCDATREEKIKLLAKIGKDNPMAPIAWPIDILFDEGCFCGYTMKKIEGTALVNLNAAGAPVEERIQAAIQLCSSTISAHRLNLIVGDLSLANAMRNEGSLARTVYLFDTDSFQVPDFSRRGIHTTKELRLDSHETKDSVPGKTILSTAHDNYLLACAIFQLLYGFLPTDSLSDAGSIKESHREHIGEFPYEKEPHDLPVNFFGGNLETLFKKAFMNPSACPSATDFRDALNKVLSEGFEMCPECGLERPRINNKPCPNCKVGPLKMIAGKASQARARFNALINSKPFLSAIRNIGTAIPLSIIASIACALAVYTCGRYAHLHFVELSLVGLIAYASMLMARDEDLHSLIRAAAPIACTGPILFLQYFAPVLEYFKQTPDNVCFLIFDFAIPAIKTLIG